MGGRGERGNEAKRIALTRKRKAEGTNSGRLASRLALSRAPVISYWDGVYLLTAPDSTVLRKHKQKSLITPASDFIVKPTTSGSVPVFKLTYNTHHLLHVRPAIVLSQLIQHAREKERKIHNRLISYEGHPARADFYTTQEFGFVIIHSVL